METKLLATQTPDELSVAVDFAASPLAAGDPVALPTETVYGLATDALRPESVLKIFASKERPGTRVIGALVRVWEDAHVAGLVTAPGPTPRISRALAADVKRRQNEMVLAQERPPRVGGCERQMQFR